MDDEEKYQVAREDLGFLIAQGKMGDRFKQLSIRFLADGVATLVDPNLEAQEALMRKKTLEAAEKHNRGGGGMSQMSMQSQLDAEQALKKKRMKQIRECGVRKEEKYIDNTSKKYASRQTDPLYKQAAMKGNLNKDTGGYFTSREIAMEGMTSRTRNNTAMVGAKRDGFKSSRPRFNTMNAANTSGGYKTSRPVT